MNLRETAAADFQAIAEDSVSGFGWSVTLVNPAGASASVTGLTTDIAQVIDPETGVLVGGRAASLAVARSSLETLGLGTPVAVSDESKRPWVVIFNDVNGSQHSYKVREVLPDRAIGSVVLILEAYDIT